MRPRRYAETHSYADHLLYGAAFAKEAAAPFTPLYGAMRAFIGGGKGQTAPGASAPLDAKGPVAKRVGKDVEFQIRRPEDWVMFRMQYGRPGATGKVAFDPPPDGNGP